eukprot:896812-Amorphochlora_amoeboformis.AAC.1
MKLPHCFAVKHYAGKVRDTQNCVTLRSERKRERKKKREKGGKEEEARARVREKDCEREGGEEGLTEGKE